MYRFRDERDRVIYVGKASNLRARLGSYFQDLANLHPRTQTMVTSASRVEWTVVRNEVEALQLEYSWIKEFDPRFNIKYRDDKSYPSLAVTLNEEFPRLQVMRGPKKKGVRYFGPYSHAWAIRETLDLLLRVFPARTCSAGVFKRAGQVGRPCLLGYIGKCSAPCVGRVSADEHRRIVEDFCDFMAGQTSTYLRRLEKDMQVAAAGQEYERAARLRDDIKALERAVEKQSVVLGDGTDADVVAFAEDPLEAAVQVFYVRGGRVRGQRGWVVDKVEDLTTGDLVEHFIQQVYGGIGETGDAASGWGDAVPREVLVPALPPDAAAVQEWLSTMRGSNVDLRVPQRGDKRSLMETVARNAAQSLALHKTKRGSDLTTRSQALQELQDALGLDEAPLRIECYDVSHLQESDVVASHGRLRGRPGPQVRVPPLRRARLRRPRRRRLHLRGDQQAVPPLRGGAGRDRRDRGRPRTTPRSRRASTRRPAGRGGSPTRPTWWWSTAAHRRSRLPSGRSTSSASTTSPSAASPSGWRRCGCPATRTRWCCRAPARASTCCSGSATRRTGSPSPSTVVDGRGP